MKAKEYTKRDFIRVLKANGYEEVDCHDSGNHQKWVNPETKREIVLVKSRDPNRMWVKRMIKEHNLKI